MMKLILKLAVMVLCLFISNVSFSAQYHSGFVFTKRGPNTVTLQPLTITGLTFEGSHAPELGVEYTARIRMGTDGAVWVSGSMLWDGVDTVTVTDVYATSDSPNPWVSDMSLSSAHAVPVGIDAPSTTHISISPEFHYSTSIPIGSRPCYVIAIMGGRNAYVSETNTVGNAHLFQGNSTYVKSYIRDESDRSAIVGDVNGSRYDYYQANDQIEFNDSSDPLVTVVPLYSTATPAIILAQKMEAHTGSCVIIHPLARPETFVSDWDGTSGDDLADGLVELQYILDQNPNHILAGFFWSDFYHDYNDDNSQFAMDSLAIFINTIIGVTRDQARLYRLGDAIQSSSDLDAVPHIFTNLVVSSGTGIANHNAALASGWDGSNTYGGIFFNDYVTSVINSPPMDVKDELGANADFESLTALGAVDLGERWFDAWVSAASLIPTLPQSPAWDTGNDFPAVTTTSVDIRFTGGLYSASHDVSYTTGTCPSNGAGTTTVSSTFGGDGTIDDQITGLEPGTDYCVGLIARNNGGTSDVTPVDAGSLVSTSSGVPISGNVPAYNITPALLGCDITWTPPSTGDPIDISDGANGYQKLWYCKGATCQNWQQEVANIPSPGVGCVVGGDPDSCSYTISGGVIDQNDTEYNFYIEVGNGYTMQSQPAGTPAYNDPIVGQCIPNDGSVVLGDWLVSGGGELKMQSAAADNITLVWDAPNVGLNNSNVGNETVITYTMEICTDSDINGVCDTGGGESWSTLGATFTGCDVGDSGCTLDAKAHTGGTPLAGNTQFIFNLTADIGYGSALVWNDLAGSPAVVASTSSALVELGAPELFTVMEGTGGAIEVVVDYDDDGPVGNIGGDPDNYTIDVRVGLISGEAEYAWEFDIVDKACVLGTPCTYTVVNGARIDSQGGTGGVGNVWPVEANLDYTVEVTAKNGHANSHTTDQRLVGTVAVTGSRQPRADSLDNEGGKAVVFQWDWTQYSDAYCENSSVATLADRIDITTTCLSRSPVDSTINISRIDTKETACYDKVNSEIDNNCGDRTYTTSAFVQDFAPAANSDSTNHWATPNLLKGVTTDVLGNAILAGDDTYNDSLYFGGFHGEGSAGSETLVFAETGVSDTCNVFFWSFAYDLDYLCNFPFNGNLFWLYGVTFDGDGSGEVIDQTVLGSQYNNNVNPYPFGVSLNFDDAGNLCVGDRENRSATDLLTTYGATPPNCIEVADTGGVVKKGSYYLSVQITDDGNEVGTGEDIKLRLWDIGKCADCVGGMGYDDIDPVIYDPPGGTIAWEFDSTTARDVRTAGQEIHLGSYRWTYYDGFPGAINMDLKGSIFSGLMVKGGDPYDDIDDTDIKIMITQYSENRI